MCTNGVIFGLSDLANNCAHFRHGLDSNDALDGKIRLIIGRQAISR